MGLAHDDQLTALSVKESILQARSELTELPPSRERSLVETKLQEAQMWLDGLRQG